MSSENTAEFQEVMDDNYTCVSFKSLQLYIPGSEVTSDDIVRDYPPEPLTERTPSEIEGLRTQPFSHSEQINI